MTKTATPAETAALNEFYALLDQAKGENSALADVRRQIVGEIDALLGVLVSAGVDTDALLDGIGR